MKHYYITFEDRQTIEELHKGGSTPKEIAETIGKHIATIYRELHRGFTGEHDSARLVYSANQAQQIYKAALTTKGYRK